MRASSYTARMPIRSHGSLLPAATLLILAAAAGCGTREPASTAPEPPRIETMQQGKVEVVIKANPPRVRFDRDMLLTLTVTAPAEIDVTLPTMEDRLQGFVSQESYTEEPVEHDGRRTRTLRVRVTPVLAEEYRLAPMAIRTVDKGRSPPRTGWFPTRPIRFETVAPSESVPGDLQGGVEPLWIYPPFKTVALWVLLALAALALCVVLWKLLRRVHREVQLRRLSPRERAMKELDMLLAKHLVEAERFKDFYLELTMIVRRYIERQHAIRAPEQTTEEFLAAAVRNPHFTADVLARLREFLEAADLVKFAAVRPEPGSVANATDTARHYIDHDARHTDATRDRPPDQDQGQGD